VWLLCSHTLLGGAMAATSIAIETPIGNSNALALSRPDSA